ncbi:MAG: diguanylate cyclase [Candidatus Pacearchaeota archaeon]|nr:diguanylate cyclase [Candidatus Pacearchaeota archaeon]
MIARDDIIKVSCGIGRSFEEAARAVAEAKKEKGKTEFNVKIYHGPRLRSKLPESFKQRVEEYRKLARGLTEEQKKILENFSLRDPLTGLLNKMGFVLELEKLKQKGITEGYYLLFDIDDLHDWNNKLGYAEVDKYIEIIGQTIQKNIRHEKLVDYKERVADIVGHRLNESAGDEFLIFVPAEHNEKNLEKLKLMATRLLEKIYEKQIEMKINS